MTTTQPLAFVDTETDGLHHGRHPWEVAIIRRDPDGSESVHEFFVTVPSFRISDSYGLNVGRFFERHPQGRDLAGLPPIPGPELLSTKAAARLVHQLLHGAHLVGVNPTFDVNTLSALLRSEGLPAEPWDYHLEDLVAQTVGYLRGRLAVDPELIVRDPSGAAARAADVVALPWKSDVLAAAIGVPPIPDADRHTALGDARWAMRWHHALTSRVGAEASA